MTDIPLRDYFEGRLKALEEAIKNLQSEVKALEKTANNLAGKIWMLFAVAVGVEVLLRLFGVR